MINNNKNELTSSADGLNLQKIILEPQTSINFSDLDKIKRTKPKEQQ